MWPYIAPTIINDLKKLCVICEAIVAGETNDAYIFILRSLFKMAPGRKPSDVHSVYSDEFLNRSVLDNTGLGHAKLFYDHYHIRKNHEKIIAGMWIHLRDNIYGMINALKESDFKHHYSSALVKAIGNGNTISLLNAMNDKRSTYSRYSINSTKGTIKNIGSNSNEQNHHSVVSFLPGKFSGELEDVLKSYLKDNTN